MLSLLLIIAKANLIAMLMCWYLDPRFDCAKCRQNRSEISAPDVETLCTMLYVVVIQGGTLLS